MSSKGQEPTATGQNIVANAPNFLTAFDIAIGKLNNIAFDILLILYIAFDRQW